MLCMVSFVGPQVWVAPHHPRWDHAVFYEGFGRQSDISQFLTDISQFLTDISQFSTDISQFATDIFQS